MAVELAARRIKRLMVFMPPRHGKSTFISHYFPAWYLGTFPNHNIILGSYEAGFAAVWGGRVRDTMAEFGPALWGLTVKSDYRAASDWRLTGRGEDGLPVVGGMRTAGVGTGVTGRGANLVIIDDPIKDAQQAHSETYRRGLWDWYQSTLYTRLEPDDQGREPVMVVMHTRWHEKDLAGMLLETEREKWAVLSLPALAEDRGGIIDPLGRRDGEPLWPERWTKELLLGVKGSLSPYWWGALYQQHPAPAEGNIFKRRWWKFWKPAGLDLPAVTIDLPDDEGQYMPEVVDLPGRFDWRAHSWDLTFKKGEATSYVVGQAWARKGGNAFLLGQHRERLDFVGTVEAFQAFCTTFPWERKMVEDKANASALISTLARKIPGIIPVQVEGNKEERARAVSPYVESGNVYLPHPAIAPWVHGFIDRTATHPHGDNDEGDAMSQALNVMFRGTEYEQGDFNILRR